MNPNSYFFKLCIGILAWLFLSSDSIALDLSIESNEPIKINASRAELNDKTGQSIYSGNVVITQGRSRLEADKVTVLSDDFGIKSFVASGKLVHLLQYDTKAKTETHAYAKSITFDREKNEILLQKKARLIQDNNSFKGEKIRYNTVKRVVTAESDSKRPIEIIYKPNKATP